jgi:hypothetical protein
MMGRELLHLLWNAESGLEAGVRMMQDLGLRLEVERYGKTAAPRSDEVNRLNMDVDAYLHPIVNVYRFEEAIDLFRKCKDLQWAAINSLNIVGASKLVDLAEAEPSAYRCFCVTPDELFEKESLRNCFRKLGQIEKLRAMELLLKPTGFTIIGGRSSSYTALGPRVIGDAITF